MVCIFREQSNSTALRRFANTPLLFKGFSTECLCEWKSFIALSGPSIVLSASEWLCFELGIISTGE